ncbi:hypothetical protein Tco_0667447 [Tanacetum coccineum]
MSQRFGRLIGSYRDILEGVFGHGVKIDTFEQEYEVIKMVRLMIVSDAYHGCFHVFVTVRIGAAVGSICYLHARNMVFGSPSCGKCSLCSLDLPDGRPFNVELKSISTLEMTLWS